MIELTEAEFAEAEQRGAALLAGPRAETVHFDRGRNRIIVRLTTGVEIGFSPRDAQGLQNASLTDLRQVEVDAMGLAIRFPALDADFYVPALLDGILGSANFMAEQASLRARRAG